MPLPLIVFATYWNEIDWIRASLAQIEALDPMEAFLCDGCFDSGHVNRSTDGTREIIGEFTAARPHWKRFDAIRLRRGEAPGALFRMTRPAGPEWTPYTLFSSLRNGVKKNLYRINQAITFGAMMKQSEYFRPGRWFMTVDADQFYPDSMIERFREILRNPGDTGLITAGEMTFFKDFSTFVRGYEKRRYNNMPHRIYENTQVFPTRLFKLAGFWKARLYEDAVPCVDVGEYHHYRFRKGARQEMTYQLGDRKPPRSERFANPVTFQGPLSSVVSRYYKG
ncbi:MAG: hypothetical protein ACP5I4_13765 [Oceanipulchritudo sp.]